MRESGFKDLEGMFGGLAGLQHFKPIALEPLKRRSKSLMRGTSDEYRSSTMTSTDGKRTLRVISECYQLVLTEA